MTSFQKTKQDVLNYIATFPKSKNGKHFITSKHGKKIFFNIFIKKYGLD